MPAAPAGGILVQTTHSVISPGTERMKVEQAKMNLLQKARARPDQGTGGRHMSNRLRSGPPGVNALRQRQPPCDARPGNG